MADNSSSGVVAIFAIVIIALLAFGGYYLLLNKRGATDSTSVKVELPSTSKSSSD